MNYKLWNLRTVPHFKEENNGYEEWSTISIGDFREAGIYDAETRQKLADYLKQARCIIASTLFRFNAFTKKMVSGLSLHTDGEVLFDNLLFEYITEPDFALPSRWFEIIKQKNFVCDLFELDFDLIIKTDDIFTLSGQSFDETPIVKTLMKK